MSHIWVVEINKGGWRPIYHGEDSLRDGAPFSRRNAMALLKWIRARYPLEKYRIAKYVRQS